MTKSVLILLVEDNLDEQHIVTRKLKKRGFEILIASNGLEALEKADSERRPDIILMDFQLPEMGGIKATEKLKENPNTQDIPIIAISSYIDQTKKDELTALGFEHLCLKPLDYEKLFEFTSALVQKNDIATEAS